MNKSILSKTDQIKIALTLVGVIWVVFLIDLVLPLEYFGLRPRRLVGLIGIFTMPFLHGGFGHIISNTIPLIVLLTILIVSRKNHVTVVISIVVIGGTLLWLFGRNALHIGASALIFGLITFLILTGVLNKRLTDMAIAVFVGIFYGVTMLTGILPLQPGVSWDGHLSGAIAGVASAFLFRRPQTR